MNFEHLESRISKLYRDFFDRDVSNTHFLDELKIFPSIAKETKPCGTEILQVARVENNLFGLYSVADGVLQEDIKSSLSCKDALSILKSFSDKGYPEAQFLYARGLEKQNDISEECRSELVARAYGKVLENPYSLTELKYKAFAALNKGQKCVAQLLKVSDLGSFMKYTQHRDERT